MAAPTTTPSNVPEFERIGVNSKPFHIESFRDEWLRRLKPEYYSFQKEDEESFHANFAADLGVSEETMAELKSVCSLDSLRCHPEGEEPDTELVPPNPTLKTLIQRKKKQDYKASLKISKNRHEHLMEQMERSAVGRQPCDGGDLAHEGEILLTINVYHPGLCEKFMAVRPHTCLLLMGSHSLTDLRDAICCVSDLQVCGEFSNTPDMAPDFISKDHFKSAFFFFEGIFYNDMRFPECQDISITTIEWAKTRNYPDFQQARMEDTRFLDLKIKVGYPYYYCHQGDCEHLVIVTDVRMLHMNDCRDKKQYPLVIHKSRASTQKCSVCYTFIARWHTSRDELAPSDPCLFCNQCFRMLHYDKDGNKLCSFEAFSYVDRGAFN